MNTEFEWDDAKAAANLRKHKVSFGLATRVFDDLFALVERDLGGEFGEERGWRPHHGRLHRARRPHPHHFRAKGQQL
jgi:uncharacterized DUF497 family protein